MPARHSIQLEYEKNRTQAIIDALKLKEDIYAKYPELSEIEEKINKLGIDLARATILNNDEQKMKLKNEVELLKEKRQDILNTLNLPLDLLAPKFSCSYCDDTGIDKKTNKMCVCYKQKIINSAYKQTNMELINTQSFQNFDVRLFSDKIDIAKYKLNISPRENMKKIRQIAEDFVSHFDYPDMKNLLFIGNTGLGKTFTSSCIARELVNVGKTVIYQTAPRLLDLVMDYKMRFDRSENFSDDEYNSLFEVDLLIIDDLGTESINASRLSEIFNIINTRMMTKPTKKTKTLLSTNLNIEEFAKRYDDRALSRVLGDFKICPFIGEDLRLKKEI